MKKSYSLLSFLLLWLPVTLLAQDVKTLSGVITDSESKQPLSGVSVLVKGTDKGVVTGTDGKYIITAGKEQFLQFSLVGYQSREVAVKDDNIINLLLQRTNKQLDEVVVVGYGTQERKKLIGSVSKVKAEEIKQIPVAGFDAQLQGKAAGVQINSNSGMPGDAVYIRIRGTTSINASNEPLYIVDGVFINNKSLSTVDLGGKSTSPISDINPTDIASIEILKDASATAIYGARGANGVVIITTKRGDFNTLPRVNLNASQGWSWANKDRLWNLTTGPEHATLVNEQWINSGIDNPALNRTFANRPFRPVSEGGRGLPEEQQTYDRLSDLFRTGLLQNYDLSLEGGTKTTRYFIGGSYTRQEANIRPALFDRASFKVNLDQKVNEKIQVGVSNTISHSYRNQVREGTGPQAGIFQAGLHTPTYLPKTNPDGTPGRWAGFDNLQVLIDNYNVNTRSLRYIGNLYADAEIVNGLRFRTSWSLDYNNYDESEIWNDKTLIGLAPTNGRVTSSITQNTTWINEQTLSYRKNAGAGHGFGILVGNTIQSNVLKNNSAVGTNFPNNAYTQISSAANKTASQSWTKATLASFFGRIDYNFAGKYFLEASVRADASSRFGENNQWGYFPSVGAAWRIKEESFLREVDALSELKVRVSYGVTGNQNGIGDFAAQGLWTGNASYPDNIAGGDKPGTAPEKLGNPDLRWEKTQQFDGGLDIGFFKGRLLVTVDAYYKYTTDLLLPLQVPSISGFNTYVTNAGEISNKGFEVGINSVNIKSRYFNWQTSFTISGNSNRIEKLSTPVVYGDRDLIRLQEGSPMYSFWLYKQLYVDPQTGNAVFEDVNKDGQITVADRQIMGNASPKVFGGLTNNFSWKGFDASVLFTYQYGNKIVSFDRILGEGGGTKDANRMILAYNLRRWQKPGDITDVPRVTSVGNNYAIEQTSRLLEDGSFVRLRSLSIGYTLPKSILSKIKLETLRVYVIGTNLWLNTNYIGPDPEASHSLNPQGVDVGTPPQPRTIQFGINATL